MGAGRLVRLHHDGVGRVFAGADDETGAKRSVRDGQEVFGHGGRLERLAVEGELERPHSVLPTDRVVKLTYCSTDSYLRSG